MGDTKDVLEKIKDIEKMVSRYTIGIEFIAEETDTINDDNADYMRLIGIRDALAFVSAYLTGNIEDEDERDSWRFGTNPQVNPDWLV